MKIFTSILLLVLGVQVIYAQERVSSLDITPDPHKNMEAIELLSPWETIFQYPVVDSLISSGIETDGQYYYICGWNTPEMQKYDMQGNLLEIFNIPGINGICDMAYDGQYFYGANTFGPDNIIVIDFENKTLIDTWPMPFNVRAIAYNDDLDVFYVNNWGEDIKVITSGGAILDTIPLTGTHGNYYSFAYDNWSEGGPYLWGFSQDGPSHSILIQLQLPSCEETGFIMDLGYLGNTIAGGLFTHPDIANDRVIIGGVFQNETYFGLELGTAIPHPESNFAVNYLHGSLIDSLDVQLKWAAAKQYVLNEYFNSATNWPPTGWTKESNGKGWWNFLAYYQHWDIPDWDSRFAVAAEDYMMPDGCCDYLISPYMELDNAYDYNLSFESYFDGTASQSSYVKYSIGNDTNWTLLYQLSPEPNEWNYYNLDLSAISTEEQVRIAFHADDNGVGSGWAIDNVMLYTNDITPQVLGYELFRDGIKINTGLLTDTSFNDLGVSSGKHTYYVNTVYSHSSIGSGEIEFLVPHYPPPPPSPDCNPPLNLQAIILDPPDSYQNIMLTWETPDVSFSKDNAWAVQFNYPLAGTNGEAGAECTGTYIYTSNRLGPAGIYKYDLNGNYLGIIDIFGLTSLRNMAYVPSIGITYMAFGVDHLDLFNLNDETFHGNLFLPAEAKAIAYNDDLDAFYVNDGSSDIMLVDRETGNLISSFICGTHGNYYDFAYDNWSDGGPYLWGFSGEGENGCTIVQISLPDGLETGFTYDASWLSANGNGMPGGLFIQEGIVPGTVSLCGLIQNEVMFGLELGPADWNFYLGGYNVYMDNNLHNSQLIDDTTYLLSATDLGTYSFEVSAVYIDSLGDVLCESALEGPVEVIIATTDVFLVGGNVITGAYKLDEGEVGIYRFDGGVITDEQNTEVDEIGYYLFTEMVPSNYMMQARPGPLSTFYSSYCPTYTGDMIHWEDVSTTTINAHSYNNDIHLVEMATVNEGTGLISGAVFEDGTDSETPLADVQVMLLNQQGSCILLEYTNTEGAFSFDNLALQSYKILVEIPGKSMTPYTVYLGETDPEKTDIDLYVLSDEIVFSINDDLPEWIDFISEIYPNPAKNNSAIKVRLDNTAEMQISLYDVSGMLMHQQNLLLNKGFNCINIDLHDLNSGIYFVNLEFEYGYLLTKKLLLIR